MDDLGGGLASVREASTHTQCMATGTKSEATTATHPRYTVNRPRSAMGPDANVATPMIIAPLQATAETFQASNLA